MRNFYLVGKNISKSKSPVLHNTIFKHKGRDVEAMFELYPEDKQIPSISDLIQSNLIGGLAITIPYKREYVSEEIQLGDHACRKTKVINTLVKRDNKLWGFNTDFYGIDRTLSPIMNFSEQGSKQTYLVLGAGATASTFCYFLSLKGVKVILVNRGQQNLDKLKQEYQQTIIKTICFKDIVEKQTLQSLDVRNLAGVVNTVPAEGIKQYESQISALMKGIQSECLAYMNVLYKKDQVEVINPIILGEISHKTKIQVASGLDMLVWQAVQQNRHFCNQEVHTEAQYTLYSDLVRKAIT